MNADAVAACCLVVKRTIGFNPTFRSDALIPSQLVPESTRTQVNRMSYIQDLNGWYFKLSVCP